MAHLAGQLQGNIPAGTPTQPSYVGVPTGMGMTGQDVTNMVQGIMAPTTQTAPVLPTLPPEVDVTPEEVVQATHWADVQKAFGYGTPNLTPEQLSKLNALQLWVYHVGHPDDSIATYAAISAGNATPGTMGYDYGATWEGGGEAMTALEGVSAKPFVEEAQFILAPPMVTEPITPPVDIEPIPELETQSMVTGAVAPMAPVSIPTPVGTAESFAAMQGLGAALPKSAEEFIMSNIQIPPKEPTTVTPETVTQTCPYCGLGFDNQDDLINHAATCSLNPSVFAEPGSWAGYMVPSDGVDGGGFDYLNTVPWGVGTPPYMEELYGRWPGFGTALGLYGRAHLSPHEQYLASRAEPLSLMYDIGGRMAPYGYAPDSMYSEWAPGYAQNPAAMYGLAENMMGSLVGMSPELRAQAEMPATGGDFGSLLEMALRTRLGRNTANWISGRIPAEQQAYTAMYPQQMMDTFTGPTFLDYVLNKYGIAGYF